MFGKKKTLAEKMTTAYQKAHAEKDAGARYLALDSLGKVLSKMTVEPKRVYGKDGSVAIFCTSMVSGACIGGAIAGPVGMIGGFVFGGAAGLFGSLSYDPDERRFKKQRLFYTTEVIPHLATLQTLNKQVTHDIETLRQDTILLGKSASLKKLLLNDPALVDIFRSAQRVEKVDPIPTVAANQNKTNDSKPGGFRQLEL